MELAYLCCARQGDILELKKSQITGQGIFINQSKTSVPQIKAWTERFNMAITIESELPTNHSTHSVYLLHQKSGSRYTLDSFNAQWMKAKKLAKNKYPDLDFDFTSHDLKAKGISDLDGSLGEKQIISGHKTQSQTARYNRKIVVVPVVGGQKT